MQMEGMFDVPPSEKSEQRWQVEFPLPDDWSVGVIVGPSGSGKSTIAREIFGANLVTAYEWPSKRSLLDGFPASMGIKEIVQLLSSVGFSSPPSWVRPFHVLSNGEQFRVTMARALSESQSLCVVDEFTSVVDRTVAKIGSAAIAKTVRRRKQRFIAVSCHYDIVEWLEPDWVYQPHLNKFEAARGSLRRPPIQLEIRRVHHSAWRLFKHHHYLSGELNTASVCFAAFTDGHPVAFIAWLPFVGHLPFGQRAKRCHRVVCLPDFQGVGIGNGLLTETARQWSAQGFRAFISSGHPAEVAKLSRDRFWKITKAPTRRGKDGGQLAGRRANRSLARLTASFEFRPQKNQAAPSSEPARPAQDCVTQTQPAHATTANPNA